MPLSSSDAAAQPVTGGGDMLLGAAQTNTGVKTFNTGTLIMTSTAGTGEPYSDANPPTTLNLSDQATSPTTPVAGQSTLYTTDGTNLNLKDNAGTTITVADTASTQALTNKNLTGAGNTFPTFNQSTTGNAATATTLQTARTINGVSFNGSANITVADATKEPTITAGTTAQYYRGDKSFQTLNQDAVPDGTTNKAFTATNQTKLAGVAPGATANDTDANLKARANHTGTQAASTITGLATVATTGVYADLTGKPTVPATFDDLTDGTTNKAFTSTEKSKLALQSGTNTGDQLTINGSLENKRFVTSKMTYLNDGNVAWDNFYAAGDGALDTSSYVTGTGSIKVTTQTLNTYAGVSKEVVVDINNKDVRLFVKSSDWAKVGICTLILSSNSYTLSNTLTLDIKTRLINPPNGEWIEVVVPKSAFIVDGTPNWSAINLMLFRVRDNNVSFADVSLDSVSSFARGGTGLVSVTFDDGYDDVAVEGKKYLDKYGFAATAYIVPSVIGTAGFLSQAQVDSLHKVGWDISGHSLTNLTTLSAGDLETDLRTTKEYLTSKGYRGADQYAFPNGAYNNAVIANVSKYFSSGTNIDGWNNSLGHLSPYRINRQSIDKFTTTGMVQTWIDNAIANNEWLILNFHTLVTTEVDGQDWTIAKFSTAVDYLNTSGAKVKTVSEVLASRYTAIASTDLSDSSSIVLTTGAQTMTNKRVTKRVGTVTTNATITPTGDTADLYTVTALAANATIAAPTGTPTNGQELMLRIKDNGTSRTLTFNAIYRFSSDLAAPTATVISKTLYMKFVYNSTDTKWDALDILGNF